MRLIFLDTESTGGNCPANGVMTEFGAVDYQTRNTFHGYLYARDGRPLPRSIAQFAAPGPDGIVRMEQEGFDDPRDVFVAFDAWLRALPGRLENWRERLVMVSDNPAWDYQWINHGFLTTLGVNPFGHSARRIGDFYAGLVGDFKASTRWKALRVTKHDHNPVNDAIGNVEAFERMLAGERVK